jgi:hypothetical protein
MTLLSREYCSHAKPSFVDGTKWVRPCFTSFLDGNQRYGTADHSLFFFHCHRSAPIVPHFFDQAQSFGRICRTRHATSHAKSAKKSQWITYLRRVVHHRVEGTTTAMILLKRHEARSQRRSSTLRNLKRTKGGHKQRLGNASVERSAPLKRSLADKWTLSLLPPPTTTLPRQVRLSLPSERTKRRKVKSLEASERVWSVNRNHNRPTPSG